MHLPHISSVEGLIGYLDNGGDVNKLDDQGNTLLHLTIFYNKAEKKRNEDIIKILLERKAQPDVENNFGKFSFC